MGGHISAENNIHGNAVSRIEEGRAFLQENRADETQEDQANELRYGGNYMHIEDPNKPLYTPFYVMITGHL